MEAIDLQTFADQVTEAQELLARKADVEREIVEAERRRDRVVAELARADEDLQVVCHKAQEESVRFAHEKRRYTLQLEEHQKATNQQMCALDQNHHATLREHKEAHQKQVAALASEYQALVEKTKAARVEHDRVWSAAAAFKRQLAALPG
jgi:hypothetical protein